MVPSFAFSRRIVGPGPQVWNSNFGKYALSFGRGLPPASASLNPLALWHRVPAASARCSPRRLPAPRVQLVSCLRKACGRSARCLGAQRRECRNVLGDRVNVAAGDRTGHARGDSGRCDRGDRALCERQQRLQGFPFAHSPLAPDLHGFGEQGVDEPRGVAGRGVVAAPHPRRKAVDPTAEALGERNQRRLERGTCLDRDRAAGQLGDRGGRVARERCIG